MYITMNDLHAHSTTAKELHLLTIFDKNDIKGVIASLFSIFGLLVIIILNCLSLPYGLSIILGLFRQDCLFYFSNVGKVS